MKTYPKIPRYDHEVINSDLYTKEDLLLLEKTDGQNSRVFLYDERFSQDYTADLEEFDPEDGDVFIGTKKAIQGKLSDNLQEFKGNFHRLVKYLRENLETDTLYELHDEYDSPLILFGEHMIQHTVNYDYKESPPPVFLGFDVFPQSEYTSDTPANPYNETFEGFLPFNEAEHVFKSVGLPMINQIEGIDPPVDPNTITIPSSDYAEVKAEGVVFRSDSLEARSKKVSSEFKENMKKAWGLREDQADTGEELIIAWYMTNGRIRKAIHKKINKGEEIHLGDLAESLVKDVWIEEWDAISDISIGLNPYNVYEYTIDRCEALLDRMETNAHLNNANIEELWDSNTDIEPEINRSFDVTDQEVSQLEQAIKGYDSIEEGLVEELLEEGTILNVANEIAEQENKELDRWVIPEVRDEVYEIYWVNNLELLANISIRYTPREINSILLDTVVDVINTYVDSTERQDEDTDVNTFPGNVLDES